MPADAEYDNSLVEPIEIRMIRPSKFAVRHADRISDAAMVNLKASIKEHGLLQPILVRPLEHGFEIVAGHRRFTACRSLHHRFVSCKIRDFDDRQAYEVQLTENLQRKTMDPIEEAEAYEKYVIDFGWGGVSELARKIGKSEEYVSHRMQLLRLSDASKDRVVSKDLSVSQAMEIVGDPRREEMVEDVIQNKLTVQQIRRLKSDSQDASREAHRDGSSKTSQITKRSIFSLKIALSRIDDLIESAHSTDPEEKPRMIEFLMGMRRRIHQMIDEAIRFEKARPKH